MKFKSVSISNFRGITDVKLDELSELVIVAGPNGCGKSTIFDAIRLWKSAYAGYRNEEVQLWLQEFGLANGQGAFVGILQDPRRAMVVRAEIVLADSERLWLRNNAIGLLRDSIYRDMQPDYARIQQMGMPIPNLQYDHPIIQSLRMREPEVQHRLGQELPIFLAELDQPILSGQLTCLADGQAQKSPSPVLERVFSLFDGKNVGIIDYHGAHRTFAREEVGGINLRIDQYENQRQQSALYNYSNKYSGVKSELAAAFVRDILSEAAGGSGDAIGLRLGDTLHELFATFFPGKRFKGVQPSTDGSLKFEVETSAGTHDINDLSSGEKELLYGYLRLRNYAPQNSVVLLDEPELHLNPRLTDGLAGFYKKHVSGALNNQLWLVTHSDTILRQSVGQEGMKVFHMLTAGNPLSKSNQAKEIKVKEDIDRAVIDLIGDLATYKPGAKLIFLEGGGNSRFDQNLITELFPEFAANVNLVSIGNKARTRSIATLLDTARAAGAEIGAAYSISDKDNEEAVSTSGSCYAWDRYHIENYLIEPDFISNVIVDLRLTGNIDPHPLTIIAALKECASETMGDLVRHQIEHSSTRLMNSAISANTRRGEEFDVDLFRQALLKSADNISNLLENQLSTQNIEKRVFDLNETLSTDLNNGSWTKTFRGRDILNRFVNKYANGVVRYEVFRDLIIARMREANFKPDGMNKVINGIQDK